MKNKLILIFIMISVLFIPCLISCEKFESDTIQNGVFLISSADISESKEIPPEWVAVIDGKITVSENGKVKVYDLKKDKECYTAVSSEGTLTIVLSEDKLTIDNNGQKTEYSLSSYYKYSENIKESLIPVLEPEIVEKNGKTYVLLSGEYNDCVADGISAEIKTANSENYKSYSVANNEKGKLYVEIYSEEFVQGDNIIRLSNSHEYPMIDADKNLFMKARSGSIEYKVTVDENGNITYIQNDNSLENGVYKFAHSDDLMSSEEKDFSSFVVIDGMLTESFKGGKSLYYLGDVDGVYSMKLNKPDNNASKTFTVKNGVVTVIVKNSGKVYQLKKDDGYMYSEEKVKLEKPVNPEFGVEDYDSGQQVWFRLFALDTSYPIGVKVEIKKAGSENYEFYDIYVPYQAQIYIDGIGADKFDKGYNFIRICNVGAPVSTKDNRYYMTEDSEYVVYTVLLDETGVHIGATAENKSN